MSARDLAMKALRESPEEVAARELEERRRREDRQREEMIKRQSNFMLAIARKELNRMLGIDVSKWEVVQSGASSTVLRDADDRNHHQLTLSVKWANAGHKPRKLVVRYQPYEGYDPRPGRHGRDNSWITGPEVTDLLTLGRAIKAHEDEQNRIAASIPAHLP